MITAALEAGRPGGGGGRAGVPGRGRPAGGLPGQGGPPGAAPGEEGRGGAAEGQAEVVAQGWPDEAGPAAVNSGPVSRRLRTAAARPLSTPTVVSTSMQASVMLCP